MVIEKISSIFRCPRGLFRTIKQKGGLVMKRVNNTFTMKRLWRQVGTDLVAASKETLVMVKEEASDLKKSAKEFIKKVRK